MNTASDPDWKAHASRVLFSASRPNNLFFRTATAECRESLPKIRDREDALVTRAQALAV